MPQYAILGKHPPDNCPGTNKAVREFVKKAQAQLPHFAKQLDVKVMMWIHLDPNHTGFLLLEAPNAEAARDFLFRAGFFHYLDLDFHLVTPVDELMKKAEEFPTLY